jgi:hypothetical protein
MVVVVVVVVVMMMMVMFMVMVMVMVMVMMMMMMVTVMVMEVVILCGAGSWGGGEGGEGERTQEAKRIETPRAGIVNLINMNSTADGICMRGGGGRWKESSESGWGVSARALENGIHRNVHTMLLLQLWLRRQMLLLLLLLLLLRDADRAMSHPACLSE